MNTIHTSLTGHDVYMWLKHALEELENNVHMLDAMDLGSGLDNYTGSSAYATVKHASESVSPSAFRHIAWGLDSFASALHRSAHGIIGVLLAGFFTKLSDELSHCESSVSSTDLINALGVSCDIARECMTPAVFERDPDTVNIVLTSIAQDMKECDEDDIYQVVGRIWTAAQMAFVDSAEANNMRGDARAAVIVLLTGALADTVGNTRGAPTEVLPVTRSMLADMRVEALPTRARTRPDMPFVVRYTFRGDKNQAKHLWSMFLQRHVYAAMSGKTDVLGIGLWQVVLRTDRPHTLIPASINEAIISNPAPPTLVYPLASKSRVVSFEPLQAEGRTIVPRILAITRAPGLIEELANSSAVVFYQPAHAPSQPTLADMVVDDDYSSTSCDALIDWLPDRTFFIAPCDSSAREMAQRIIDTNRTIRCVDLYQHDDPTDTVPLQRQASADDTQTRPYDMGMVRAVTLLPTVDEIHMLQTVREWSTLTVEERTAPQDIRQLVASMSVFRRDYYYGTPYDAATIGQWITTHAPDPDDFRFTVLLCAGDASLDANRIQSVISDVIGAASLQMIRGGQHGQTMVGMMRR